MKKEVENKKSFIRVLSCSESSGDEAETELPIEKTEEIKKEIEKYLLNSDEELIKKNPPKETKKLVKKRETSSRNNVEQDQEKSIKKPKKSTQKDSPNKSLLKGYDFKRLKKRQKNLESHRLIIPKEKTINTWLNTMAKRFTSVPSTVKTSSFTKILIVETSISQKR